MEKFKSAGFHVLHLVFAKAALSATIVSFSPILTPCDSWADSNGARELTSQRLMLTKRLRRSGALGCIQQKRNGATRLIPVAISVQDGRLLWQNLSPGRTRTAVLRACLKSRVVFRRPTRAPGFDLCSSSDLSADDIVSSADMLELVSAWRARQPQADVNGDGRRDALDLSSFFQCLGAQRTEPASSSSLAGSSEANLSSSSVSSAASSEPSTSSQSSETSQGSASSNPDNQPPLALPSSVATGINRPVALMLRGDDPEGQTLTFTITLLPSHGSISGDAPQITYTPNTGFSGTDYFQFTVSDSVNPPSAPAVVMINVGGYQPPLGIPLPEFGIIEAVPVYNSADPLHYYVAGPSNCGNGNNGGRGSPSAPRCTIPYELPAGAYVEVHGGPYTYSQGPKFWTGTAEAPIIIKGMDMPRFENGLSVYNDAGGGGAYVIIDGLDLHSLSIAQGYHHVALRNSNVQGDLTSGGIGITNYQSGTVPILNNVVVYNNTIHDSGIWDPQVATGDRDIHGVQVGWSGRVENVWVLDNLIYHQEGDGVQIEFGSPAHPEYVNHIYVGRNIIHHNKQTGLWVKNARDVIFSQNILHGFRPSSSANGACAGMQYNSQYIWYIFNSLSDCEVGFGIGSDEGQAYEHYFVGNRISNIHTANFDNNDPWGNGRALVSWGRGTKYFVNNTIFDTDGGLACPSYGVTCPAVIQNTLFSQVTGSHIFLEDTRTAEASVLSHTLFDGPARVRWGNNSDQNLSQLQTLGLCIGCSEASVNLDTDLRPLSGSPAIDSGIVSAVYDTFLQRYGLSINFDHGEGPRPQGSGWDIGAYEF